MKLTCTMCHSHLMSMLLQPEKFQRAVRKYTATGPDIQYEGIAGYMETGVEFDIASLKEFTELFEDSYTYPSNRTEWYNAIKNGILSMNK